MKMLILTAHDATLLRELIPHDEDRSPDCVEKAWETRKREAKSILVTIIEAIEGGSVKEESQP